MRKLLRYTEFQQMAVDHMQSCETLGGLARELGVSRRTLYQWKVRLGPAKPREEVPLPGSRERSLRRQVHS